MTAKTQEQEFRQTEIGEIPAEWGVDTIPLANENFFECQNGLWRGKQGPFITAHVIRNTNFTSIGKIDFSDIATLEVEQKQFAKRKLNRGDIIIERSGGGPKQPVGRVVYFADDLEPYSFSNFTSRIRVLDTKTFNPKFIFFILMNFYQEGRTESLQAKTTGIRNLDFNKYKELVTIPSLDLSEQERIAFVLSEIQKAVETQEKIVAGLKELKAATMEKLFHEGTRGEPLKQTEIGEIPQSWDVVSFESFATLQRGFDLPVNSRITGNVPVIGSNGIVGYHNEAACSGPGVMTGRSGSIGLAFYIEGDYWPLNTSLFVVDFHGNRPRFVYYFFQQFNFKKYATGVSVPTLNRNSVHTAMIATPKKEEQLQIADILSQIDKSIDSSSLKLEKIKQLFMSTLHQLMTGKKRVKDLNIEEVLANAR